MFAPFVVLAIAGTVAALTTSRRKSANAAWAEAACKLRIELKPTTRFAALPGKPHRAASGLCGQDWDAGHKGVGRLLIGHTVRGEGLRVVRPSMHNFFVTNEALV